MKIIHMSDLHVGHKDLDERFHSIVRNLIFEKSDKANEYVIVITGDLVDDANNPILNSIVLSGLEKLTQAGFKYILVIPGNHDYGSGSIANKKFVSIFKQTYYGRDLEYPKKDIINNIAFIGLDSMSEELHWYDGLWAQGELGEKQLSDLNSLLQSEEIRSCDSRVIYLHHHPFDSWPLHQLRDSDNLQTVLQNAMNMGITIDAILYGHNHAGKVHNGHWNIPRCYDAGSATLKSRPKLLDSLPWFKEKSAIRIIDITKKEPPFGDYITTLL